MASIISSAQVHPNFVWLGARFVLVDAICAITLQGTPVSIGALHIDSEPLRVLESFEKCQLGSTIGINSC